MMNMNQLVVRFIASNALFIMGTAVIVVFLLHLGESIWKRGWGPTYARLGNQACIAMLIYIIGDTGVRGWGGLRLFFLNKDMPAAVDVVNSYTWVAVAYTGIAVIGCVCMMRVFSRERWGDWAWIGSVALTTIIVTALWAI